LLLIFLFLDFIIFVIPLLLVVALLSLAERKVMASIQRRRGPNVVGFFGILQPFADGLKLFLKEFVIPSNSDKVLFFLGPIFSFCISLGVWSVVPMSGFSNVYDIDLGVLFLFAVTSFGVYGVIISGWASNSRYAFLGSLRAASQMISYEVSLGLGVMPILILVSSFNFFDIIYSQQFCWNFFILFPSALIFLISAFAETNRTPFDLPEAEGELVAGFSVEYSSIFFALFFLAEFANILLMSYIFVIFFLGGWFNFGFFSLFLFYVKICCVLFLFIWVRAIVPRYRFDQLIQIGWKVFLPISMGYIIFIAGFVLFIFQFVFSC
jgi:NADH-quinone oxidoreductase subunit H